MGFAGPTVVAYRLLKASFEKTSTGYTDIISAEEGTRITILKIFMNQSGGVNTVYLSERTTGDAFVKYLWLPTTLQVGGQINYPGELVPISCDRKGTKASIYCSTTNKLEGYILYTRSRV